MQATTQRRFDLHSHQPVRASRQAVKPTPRILFVDDDPDIQTSLQMRLRPYALDVEQAFFGTQGIVEAVRARPDLILMDLAMPNGNGDYLLETIRNNRATSSIPVVVLTGMRDPAARQRVMRLGANAFLHKPVAFDDLVHTIGRYVDLHRRRPGAMAQ